MLPLSPRGSGGTQGVNGSGAGRPHPLNLSVLERISPKENETLPLSESSDGEPLPAPRVKPLDMGKLEDMGRRPSPPRTLEIQRQRILSKKSLSLGNVRSAYIDPKPPGSPKELILTLSGDLRKGGILFNQELREELEKRLKKHCHAVFEPQEIERLAKGFIYNSVEELFIDERHPEQFSLIQVREKIQYYAKVVYGHLVTCQILVSPLVERLKFLRNETIALLNEKKKSTDFSRELLQYFNLLIDTHNVQAFLDIYQKATWDRDILRLGRQACGPNVEACIAAWREWLDPNKYKSLQSPFIHNVLDHMSLTRISGKLYPIPERINPYPIIHSVGCREISRCLYNSGNPNYSSIFFIGKTENSLKRADITSTQVSEIDFFRQIFSSLYELGLPAGERDAEIFIDFKNLDFSKLKAYLKDGGTDFEVMQELIQIPYVNSRVLAILYNRNTLTAESIEGVLPAYFIPSLHMLQKASMTSWNIGNEFSMEKFKKLFDFPFWGRLLSEWRVEFHENGTVIQTKIYAVGKRINKDSMTFDENFKSIQVKFRWHTVDKLQPQLELVSITIPPNVNWVDKWSILDGLIEPTSDDDIRMKYVTDRLVQK